MSMSESERLIILDGVRATIARSGQAIMGIGGDANNPPFFYTVGRALRGLPELLIVMGLNGDDGMYLLNALDQEMKEPLTSGARVFMGEMPVIILDIPGKLAHDNYTKVANAFYKHFHGHNDYKVQQIVLCDKEGRFPPQCAAPFNKQPILGVMPGLA